MASNPSAYHLWFLRDLLVLILVSPFIYTVMRSKPIAWALLGLSAVAWFLYSDVVHARALFFFLIGCYGAPHGVRLPVCNRWQCGGALALWLAFMIANVAHIMTIGHDQPVMRNLSILSGLFAVWI